MLAYCAPPHSEPFARRLVTLMERCSLGQLRESNRAGELRATLLHGFVASAQALHFDPPLEDKKRLYLRGLQLELSNR